MKKLIITADDFGYLNHIDDAIIELVQKRIVSSVACFGNEEIARLEHQISKLLNVNNNVGIGVHLTITSKNALFTRNEILVKEIDENWQFKSSKAIKFDKLARLEEDLFYEWDAQVFRIKNILEKINPNKKIDSLSFHMNIPYFDIKLFNIFLELAIKYNLPVRSPERFKKTGIPWETIKEGFNSFSVWEIPQLLIANLFKAKEKVEILNGKKIKSTNHFMINLYGKPKEKVLKKFFRKWGSEDEVCELITHLSNGNSASEPVPNGINSNYFIGRNSEYNLLIGKGYNELTENIDIDSDRTFSNYAS